MTKMQQQVFDAVKKTPVTAEQVAAGMKRSPRTVRKHLKALFDAGDLGRTYRYVERGGQPTGEYAYFRPKHGGDRRALVNVLAEKE